MCRAALVQSVACLTTDPGVVSLIPAWSHTFMEIDHEKNSTAILLPSSDSRRVVVSYKWKYEHKVLVNHLVKLAQEKNVVRWTDHPDMTIAVDWDVKHQTKQTNKNCIMLFCCDKSKYTVYWCSKDRRESLLTNTGEFALLLGIQVASVYSYNEPTTEYCTCRW